MDTSALGVLLLSGNFFQMVCKFGNLTVKETPANFDIDNSRVLVRLFLRDGGYAQEFHAKDQSGKFTAVLSSLHKNLIAASEHRVTSSPMIAGDRPHLFGISRESLRMVYSNAQIVEHNAQRVIVCLSGTVQDHSLKCYITIQDGADHAHVSVEDNIASDDGPPLVEYLMSSYAFLPGLAHVSSSQRYDYTWAPNLRPGKDQVIGDCAFNSPAAIVQHGAYAAAIVPDMDALAECRPMPAALDLDIVNGLLFAPLLSYGFCGYEIVNNNSFCRHDVSLSRRLDPPRLSYAYDLFLSTNCQKESVCSEIGRFLWHKYGANAIRQPLTENHISIEEPTAETNKITDKHSGMKYQSGRELLKAANKCLASYESDNAKKHLDQGLKHLDQMCLLQCVCRRPWDENAPPPGMCVESNLGWKQNAVLTAEFGKRALRYGLLTGDSYYFERGTAAMRAALSVSGLSAKSMAKINACAEAVRAEYGSIFIHIGKQWGACTAGSRITRLEFSPDAVSLALAPHPGPNGHRRVVFGGMRRKIYKVRIDGRQESFTREQMAEGIPITE